MHPRDLMRRVAKQSKRMAFLLARLDYIEELMEQDKSVMEIASAVDLVHDPRHVELLMMTVRDYEEERRRG